MMQRNILAARLGRSRTLPPLLRDPRTCGNCFQLSNCALLHKVLYINKSMILELFGPCGVASDRPLRKCQANLAFAEGCCTMAIRKLHVLNSKAYLHLQHELTQLIGIISVKGPLQRNDV